MNIPSPPTDNLYKFLAISGTLIVLISIYVFAKPLNEINDKYESNIIKSNILEADRANRNKKMKKINKIIENTLNNKNTKNIKIYYNDAEIKKMSEEVEEMDRIIELKKAEITANYEVNRYIINKFKIYKLFFVVVTTFGAAIAGY